MTSAISIETDHPVSITTTRPVSVKTEGDRVTVTISAAAQKPTGLVSTPEPPNPEAVVIPAPQPRTDLGPRCLRLMVKSQQPCARPKSHKGICQTAEQIARKQAANARRARERYQNDPEYAERIKAAQRASGGTRAGGSPDAEA